ncbi:alpha/beta fold hydrolase [Phenylobacterium immobile]|uniref:alpha/beta fold hydrolase n=1 Tax=Phenylobacterium immobile TaxID=21 RepID=UPI000AD10F01|nr:alpha/beta hydrolase [Phenylobacterium immobile]
MALTAEHTSRFVRAGDVKVHYHEAGSGPALVCIHGGAPGAFGWGNFGRNMDALSAHFRTIIVDLPGYGKSDKPPIEGGQYGFYAKIFIDMLDALGIDRAHIMGMATGGGAAIKMAIDYADRVDKLVLVSSVGGVMQFAPQPTEGMKTIRGYYGGDGPSPTKMRRYLETIMYDASLITEDLVMERYAASIDPAFMSQAPEGRPGSVAAQEPVWKDLDRIKAPTYVLWGRDNRVQTYENALFMLSRIPDVQLHIYGQTGLWVPFERAAAFNRQVIDFLTED